MKEAKNAVALAYGIEMEAPTVIASGRGDMARRMLEIAEECGIGIIHDPILADILGEAEIGTCIPPETYEAVAAIFAFLEKGIGDGLF
ncbi:MAG TPA: EscU/YscU/HrcU family type III secretion system export apparatus switch protein [Treponemataceae bacterium]|nr:EscU/YscU/HrcU family type III secretion system export apparatus switch protein [Treponemataceae bacterium]HPS43427.1 EscU/YscU/HrcU family type III secretion system export apparatus switch protein [Treponemataceae bacterium]